MKVSILLGFFCIMQSFEASNQSTIPVDNWEEKAGFISDQIPIESIATVPSLDTSQKSIVFTPEIRKQRAFILIMGHNEEDNSAVSSTTKTSFAETREYGEGETRFKRDLPRRKFLPILCG